MKILSYAKIQKRVLYTHKNNQLLSFRDSDDRLLSDKDSKVYIMSMFK